MMYRILSSKSCLLSNISRNLKEDIKLCNTIDRLSNNLGKIEEYLSQKKAYDWEKPLLRTLGSMNNLNIFLTLSLVHLAILAEKIDTNFHSNIILERAKSLKEKVIVYLPTLVTEVFEILKYARMGIKEWRNIEVRKKFRQMQLKL